MNTLKNKAISSFDYPSRVKRLALCDFDETYMPFADYKKTDCGIRELEDFISRHNDGLSLLLGWVTGSSLEAVLRKSEGYITKLPHFIASSLGSEFYWIENGTIRESSQWKELINRSGFSKDSIREALSILHRQGIVLARQSEDYQGVNMECYYYYISENAENDLQAIKETALKLNIKALVNPCNPAAGDPENCFDVHFMPACCGKKEVLDFLSATFDIAPQHVWAFGDSFNDYELLMSAGNPCLVANADPALKEKMPAVVLDSEYCYGIKEGLCKII